jgi:hypothetical protein
MSGAVPLLLLYVSVALKGTVSLDVRGSMYHLTIHKEKIQRDATMYQILLFHVYMKLNMF